MAKLRAPVANGDVLAVPGFDTIPALVEENRRHLNRADVQIGGMSLRELRALARREVLPSESDAPLLLAGHQPELSHPGVWVKNFALNGLARKLGGISLNLIVDNDTLKSASLHFPALPHRGTKVHLESVAFDTFTGEVPYEDRLVIDAEFFRSFPNRTAPLWANWGYEPLLPKVWRPARNIGDAFTAMRQEQEAAWGCRNHELTVSRLSQTEAFALFAHNILGDLSRFRDVYNAAIRAYRIANGIRSNNHPAPELAAGEGPFWVRMASGRRARANPTSKIQQLRPRALTLTLFARVCLGDFFIHGIGGGKYDEVTDDIIRNYFGVEPPAYQVLSATLHLPLPAFPSTPADLKRAEHRVRDLHWNPQRYLPASAGNDPDVEAFFTEKVLLMGYEPPVSDHAARKEWYRRFRLVGADLRRYVADQLPAADLELSRVRDEVAANAVLQRRDYSWVLYPEATLRPFLQRFLKL